MLELTFDQDFRLQRMHNFHLQIPIQKPCQECLEDYVIHDGLPIDDFQCFGWLFHLYTLKFIWVKNPKIPGIQPTNKLQDLEFAKTILDHALRQCPHEPKYRMQDNPNQLGQC